MELGNILFGNGVNGTFPINQREEFEKELFKLLSVLGLDIRGYSENGAIDDTCATFDNDIFTIRPYYWGDDEEIGLLPNFLYKPTGFSIDWYKYPLRDSYMNQDLSLEEFKEIINKCIKGVV